MTRRSINTILTGIIMKIDWTKKEQEASREIGTFILRFGLMTINRVSSNVL